MLELRPNCECCDRDLPAASIDARICSFECTFCADCVRDVLLGACPNCGGGFVPRPIRPSLGLAANPPSTVRIVGEDPRCVANRSFAIRPATSEDWPAMWPLMEAIIRRGDTYSYDCDLSETATRAIWLDPPPSRAAVAVDGSGRIVGTSHVHPNHGGPASHVANASFMVDERARSRGAGRALGSEALGYARRAGYLAMQFNAVVETNERAVRLWQSLGFVILATIPQAFRHPDGRLVGLHIMHRTL